MKIAGIDFELYESMDEMICEDADHMLGVMRTLMDEFEKINVEETDDKEKFIDSLLPLITGENARKICASFLSHDKMTWDEKYKALAKMKLKERNEVLVVFFNGFLGNVMKAQENLTGILGKEQSELSEEK
jgi:hypothetical protein